MRCGSRSSRGKSRLTPDHAIGFLLIVVGALLGLWFAIQ